MATTTTARTTVPLLTYADLDFIPKEWEGDRNELFDGKLVVAPSPIPAHQIVSDNAVHELNRLVRPHRLGHVFAAPIDVVFAPKLVAVPDVVLVGRERLPIVGPKAIEGAPDLMSRSAPPRPNAATWAPSAPATSGSASENTGSSIRRPGA